MEKNPYISVVWMKQMYSFFRIIYKNIERGLNDLFIMGGNCQLPFPRHWLFTVYMQSEMVCTLL